MLHEDIRYRSLAQLIRPSLIAMASRSFFEVLAAYVHLIEARAPPIEHDTQSSEVARPSATVRIKMRVKSIDVISATE